MQSQMFTAIAGVHNLTANNLVAKALFVETKLTANPYFATPVPTLADLKTAREELEAAIVLATDGGKSAHLDKRLKESAMVALLTEEAGYVTATAAGDVVKIISSGFDVRKKAEAIGGLPAPANLSATFTNVPGQAKLRWKPVRGAYLYDVYRKPDAPDQPMELVAQVTAARFLDEDLKTGSFYWYQVNAIGAAGPGPMSDPAKTLIA